MSGTGIDTLGPTERLAWLRLIRSENVGPVTFRGLLARFGDAEATLEALPELARRGGRRRPIRICPAQDAERELEALEKIGARLLAVVEPDYPPALAALEHAPPVVSVLGRTEMLQQRAVAVVGARNASANGRRLARDIAQGLGQAGFLVASGLARGIDTAAHRGALETGTAAVVAGGLDVIYPPENEALHGEIAERGVLLSEMPPGTVPQARHFPRRNRLISGMSLGVLVVEAAPRSGSLITARLALDQGREVFAVPGSPLDPRARGCNDLLRQGAGLVESADDVVQALDGMIKPLEAAPKPSEFLAEMAPAASETEVSSGRRSIEELLSPAPVAVDELVRQCHLSPAVVNTVLLELELAGRAERHPGNRFSSIAAGDIGPS
ncbi:MAG: DNA-processing protein DprA [Rhodospirillales bacterium]|nr:DNA-processing protein DprA [Rhodospirillales bacterium]MDH3911209.1 DNA-processing protein DprA [Rhodospirillales bacterium]MDH3918570.1 DNA-processing protein DprA [Rhodospirillales bacterium]MDH3966798.1 DNA-processing protein DprA [Rhodospirillales bacterium]